VKAGRSLAANRRLRRARSRHGKQRHHARIAWRRGWSRARSSARSPTREGTGRPLSPLWVGDALDANPMAPPSMARPPLTACGDLRRRGGALIGVVAHDVHPDGGVADVAREVQCRPRRATASRYWGNVRTRPTEPTHRQRVEAHVLYHAPGCARGARRLRAHRRDRESAVARHHGRHAVERGGGQRRVQKTCAS